MTSSSSHGPVQCDPISTLRLFVFRRLLISVLFQTSSLHVATVDRSGSTTTYTVGSGLVSAVKRQPACLSTDRGSLQTFDPYMMQPSFGRNLGLVASYPLQRNFNFFLTVNLTVVVPRPGPATLWLTTVTSDSLDDCCSDLIVEHRTAPGSSNSCGRPGCS